MGFVDVFNIEFSILSICQLSLQGTSFYRSMRCVDGVESITNWRSIANKDGDCGGIGGNTMGC